MLRIFPMLKLMASLYECKSQLHHDSQLMMLRLSSFDVSHNVWTEGKDLTKERLGGLSFPFSPLLNQKGIRIQEWTVDTQSFPSFTMHQQIYCALNGRRNH